MVNESSLYPNQIDGYASLPLLRNCSAPSTLGDQIGAEDINRVRNAIVAVETELGVNPSGTWGTLTDHLNAIDAYQTYLIPILQNIDKKIFVIVGDGIHSVGNFNGTTAATVQQAISALIDGYDGYAGGIVTIRDGYYNYLDGYVVVPSNIRIIGTDNVFIANDSGNSGDGYRAIFKTDGYNISIENINFLITTPASATSSSPYSAVEISNDSATISNVMVKNCSFLVDYDAYGIGIYPQNIDATFDNIKIVDNRFTAGPNFGTTFSGTEPAFIGLISDAANQSRFSSHKNMFIERNIFASSIAGKAINFASTNVNEFSNIYVGQNTSASSVNLSFTINTSPSLANRISIYKNAVPFSSFYFGTIANSSLEGNHFNNLFGLNGSGSTNLIGNDFNASSIYPSTVIFGTGNGPGVYSIGNNIGIIGAGGNVDGYGIGGFGTGSGYGGYFSNNLSGGFGIIAAGGGNYADGIYGEGASISGNGVDGYGLAGNSIGAYGVGGSVAGTSGAFGQGGSGGGFGISGIGDNNYAGGNFIGGSSGGIGIITTGGGNYADGAVGRGATLAGNGVDGYGTGNGVGIYGEGSSFGTTGILGVGGGNQADGIVGYGAILAGNGIDGYGTGNGCGIFGQGSLANTLGVLGIGGGNYADGIKGFGAATMGNGVDGYGTGNGVGIYGKGSSANTSGIVGIGGGNYADGIKGYGANLSGNGVDGYGTGNGYGIYGKGSGDGYGIYGLGSSTGSYGVLGVNGGTFGDGVIGYGAALAGNGIDGYGTGNSSGVYGKGFGIGYGVFGTSNSNGIASIVGVGTNGIVGVGAALSGNGIDGYGTGNGVGVYGKGGPAGNLGVVGLGGGNNADGIMGYGAAIAGNGVDGYGTGTGAGINGAGTAGYGVVAQGTIASPVVSSLRIVPQSSNPSSASNGDIYVNSASHTFNTYLGGWQIMENIITAVPYVGAISDVNLGAHSLTASGSSGDSITGIGATLSGNGIDGYGTGNGYGVYGLGGSSSAAGVLGYGGGNFGDGIKGYGAALAGNGVDGYGSGDGYGIYGRGGLSNGTGVLGQGTGAGIGGYFVGGPLANAIILASSQNNPNGITIDSTNVYWANSGASTVNQANKIDGSGAITIATGQSNPYKITVDSSYVYWVNNNGSGTVNRAPIGGGSVTTLASSQNSPNSIAVDSTYVYWSIFVGGVGQVKKANKTNGSGVVILASSQDYPGNIALDSSNIYWSAGGYVKQASNINGSGVINLAFNQFGVTGIAVDSNFVYWVDGMSGTINKVPIGGGSTTTLVAGIAANVFGFYVDNTFIYWSSYTDGTIKRASKVDGSTQINITSGQNNPLNITVGNTYVYWTNNVVSPNGAVAKSPINPPGGFGLVASGDSDYSNGIISIGHNGVDGYGTGVGYGIYGQGGSLDGTGVYGQGLGAGIGGYIVGGLNGTGAIGVGGGDNSDGVVGQSAPVSALNIAGISAYATGNGIGAYGKGGSLGCGVVAESGGTYAALSIIPQNSMSSAATVGDAYISGGSGQLIVSVATSTLQGWQPTIQPADIQTLIWTSPASAFTVGFLYDVAHNGQTGASSLWCCVGYDSSNVPAIQTSSDGITWTRRTQRAGYNATNNFGCIGHNHLTGGSSLWVAGGTNGEIETSTDAGVSNAWVQRTLAAPAYTGTFMSVAYGSDGYWIAVGTGGEIRTSPDGITWTKQTSGTSANLYGIAYGDGKWVAVGGSSGSPMALWSTNRTSWSIQLPTNGYYDTFYDVQFGNGLFVCPNAQYGDIQLTWSLSIYWHHFFPSEHTVDHYSVAYNNVNNYWCIVYYTAIETSTDTSYTTGTWTKQLPLPTTTGTPGGYRIRYGDGSFIAVGYGVFKSLKI